MSVLSYSEIELAIKFLLKKYNAEYALLFGSYARGEATADSDVDVVIVGGKDFIPRDILALGEDLRQILKRDADVFELREVNEGTPFYDVLMREGVRIA